MIVFRLLGPAALSVALAAAPAILAPSAPAQAQIGIGFTIRVAPPALPVYVQPPIPGPGYLWTPGYWSYADAGYFWVPGTWVQPPAVGLLWTPGYWGWHSGFYGWNAGYWGPHVGFYGGINYGFGYTGVGFFGGGWRGGVFAYNAAFVNFGGAHFGNVYNQPIFDRNVTVNNTIIHNTTINNVSFNGPGGVTAQPTAEERSAAAERHVAPTAMQTQHQQLAASNPALRESVNHGAPAIAATQHPGEFSGAHVVGARGAPPQAVAAARAGTLASHPEIASRSALPAVNRPSAPVRTSYGAAQRAAYSPHQAYGARPGVPGHAAFAPHPAMAPHAAPHGGGGGHHH
jgi:hypothetical protein